jgi:hypothetical protein
MGLTVMSSLLNEFGSDRASNVGLPSEFHVKCRHSFQEERLLPFLGMVLTAMVPHTGDGIQLDVERTMFLGLSFMVAEKILSWDFVIHGELTCGRFPILDDINPISDSN